MNTPAFLLIIFPISNIFFPNIGPVHCAHPALNILLPFSLEIVARRIVVHLPVPMFHIIFEISLKDAATFKDDLPFPLLLALHPVSLIRSIIHNILSNPMPEAILHLSLVCTVIRPFICPLPRDTVVGKFTRIDNSIGPSEDAFTTEQAVEKVPLVSISIFKGNFAGSIKTFPVDLAILRRGRYFSLPVLV